MKASRRAVPLTCALLLLPRMLAEATHAPSPTSITRSIRKETVSSPRRRHLRLHQGDWIGASPGFLPKEPDDMRVDIAPPGGGSEQLSDFLQDALSSLQNGQLPTMGSPMDTQPFVNGSSIDSSMSTATTMLSDLPGGSKVTIEQTISVRMSGLQAGATGHRIKLPCQGPPTVTSTVTVTRSPCNSSPTFTKTRSEVVTSTLTSTITVSVAESTSTASVMTPIPRPPVHTSTQSSSSSSTKTAVISTSTYSIATSPPAPPPASTPMAEKRPSGGNAPAAGFDSDVLRYHNEWRAKYQAGRLAWDNELAEKAVSWAKGCRFEHEEGFASNLDSSGSTDGKPKLSGQAVLEHWITGPNERDSYDPKNAQAR